MWPGRYAPSTHVLKRNITSLLVRGGRLDPLCHVVRPTAIMVTGETPGWVPISLGREVVLQSAPQS